MSSSHRRRLVQDQSSLRTSPPPDYFFPPTSSIDDLTSLSICLVGPSSTPFESGVFHLTLRMPQSYPQEPPKANFATKIFHPNVDDRTGDVCVDTLKRDWNPKLTLRDVLITIRCLLVYPNPTSSLNEAAGKLQLEDYDGFARHARVMTEVHASVPEDLHELVEETRRQTAAQDEKTQNGSAELSTKVVESFSNSNKSATTVIRKIKRATSPTLKAHKPKPIPVDSGSDSESAGDSGKENNPAARRPVSPPKRSFTETVTPAAAAASVSNEPTGAEESGRKSPKLKQGQQANGRKPAVSKPATTTTTTKKKVVSSAGKDAPKKKAVAKVGLKRF
jgi:ubiquitin-conjugating enzyme E2 S